MKATIGYLSNRESYKVNNLGQVRVQDKVSYLIAISALESGRLKAGQVFSRGDLRIIIDKVENEV